MRFIKKFTPSYAKDLCSPGSYTTQLFATGVQLRIASQPLEHSAIGIAFDLYLDMMPGMPGNAVEQVDAAIKAVKKATEK
ncbi:hypothetical protein [Falsochrobactrum shanghaiense]|uniref:hypothetical protein n=1 Tax=Falsochrobactrum shanghaiense TaxID=2201899 RepID=UPI001FE1BE9C|nr:hypothetical protein [Falsochrobactrum shanghaiense]